MVVNQTTVQTELPINGDKSSYQTQANYCRYHLVMPKVQRETLSMQDMVGGDYFRILAIF